MAIVSIGGAVEHQDDTALGDDMSVPLDVGRDVSCLHRYIPCPCPMSFDARWRHSHIPLIARARGGSGEFEGVSGDICVIGGQTEDPGASRRTLGSDLRGRDLAVEQVKGGSFGP